MKTLQNKITSIALNDEKNCNYSDLIGMVIKKVPQGGLGYDDMENRLKIGEVCKSANGVIEIEDGYFKYLKKCVNEMKWAVVHEDILKFHNDINEVK